MKYVVEWDTVVAVEHRLRTDVLLGEVPDFRWNFVRASGQELYSPADALVEELWERHLSVVRLGGTADHLSADAIDLDENAPPPDALAVPLEATHTPSYDTVSFTTVQAFKRESQLVERLKRVLEARGHTVQRYRLPLPNGAKLFTDIADTTDNVLWEAKGVATREAVRMAIGQLMDYRRIIPARPRLAVLLPDCPAPDLQQLLQSLNIELWYEDGDTFVKG